MREPTSYLLVGSGAEASVIMRWCKHHHPHAVLTVADATVPDGPPYLSPHIEKALTEGSMQALSFVGYMGQYLPHAPTGMLAIRATGDQAVWIAARNALHEANIELGTLVHPSVHFEEKRHELKWRPDTGVVIHAGVHIGSFTEVGKGTLINSRAVIEHDVIVGDDCFIGPGAILLGGVRVHYGAYIGAGVVIAPGVTIGKLAFVQMGANVTSDVPDNTTATTSKALHRSPRPPTP